MKLGELKKNDIYLIDHYVRASELTISEMTVDSGKNDTYYLEWKWVGDDDSNDTSIGNDAQNTDIEYSLKIKVEAESV